MKPSLMDFIVCPADGKPLKLEAARSDGTEILEGTLTCPAGHQYPVSGGVPRLLAPEVLAAQAREKSRQSFSAKWRRIPEFGHEEASRRIYVNWYLERYGFGTLDGLRNFLADKRLVLEAGTGVGRDAILYAESTKGLVFALDQTDSIDSAYRHGKHLPNLHLLQADLTVLPFREGIFDYVASDQVIHHTPDTEAAFRYLVRFVAPGGQIAVYVYKKKAPIREFCDDFLRAHYTKASEEECYEFSRAITLLGKALSDLKIDFDVPEDIPILDIKAGRHNLQRFIYWNVFKCYWNDDLDFETNVMTNFDWYHPPFAFRHTPEEVQGWCASLGLKVVNFNVVESGISVRAEKSKNGVP